ncbi:MAG: PorT family protein [Prevotella sp.]|nr:PorT family protein [Prevotella sp.]
MKTNIFASFIVLSLFGLPAFSQVGEYRSEFAVGGGLGYVMSQVGFMPEVPQGQHMNGLVGLAFRYTCEKYFSSVCAVTAELNYANVGWVQDILTVDDQPVINAATGLPEQYKRTVSYLQVPVLARMGWGRERKGFQAFIQLGPQFGFYLGESTKKNYDYDQRNLSMRTSKVVAQETMPVEHKFDYGIAGGGGVELSIPRMGHFLLEGRYYYGLGDLYGNSKRDYFGRSNLSNIVIKLTYLYDIKKTNNPKIK